MTRARALKDIIRARAAKTGERYTTARRHVLSDRQPAARKPSDPEQAASSMKRPQPPARSRGGLSDAKALEKTGHGLDYWFAVLDRFGGVDKGHTASARHLHDAHGVDGWYAQGITVAFERVRGVRAVNQRCDGEYEVSVSKVLAAQAPDVIRSLTDARVRHRWMKEADAELARGLSSALDSPTSKGFVVRPDGQGRFRYKWDGTTVQLYLLPKRAGKVSLVVTQSGLADTAVVEERRAEWRAALEALAGLYSPGSRPPRRAAGVSASNSPG